MHINWLSIIAIISSLYFIVSMISIHFFRLDLDFLYHGLSNYAIGHGSIFIKLSFLLMALSQIITGINILNQAKIQLAGYFLIFAGMGVFIVLLFPAAASDPITPHKIVHYSGSIIQSICFLTSLFILSKNFDGNNLKTYTTIYLVVGILLLLMLSIFYFIFGFGDMEKKVSISIPYGFTQKIGLLIANSWIIIISYNIMVGL